MLTRRPLTPDGTRAGAIWRAWSPRMSGFGICATRENPRALGSLPGSERQPPAVTQDRLGFSAWKPPAVSCNARPGSTRKSCPAAFHAPQQHQLGVLPGTRPQRQQRGRCTPRLGQCRDASRQHRGGHDPGQRATRPQAPRHRCRPDREQPRHRPPRRASRARSGRGGAECQVIRRIGEAVVEQTDIRQPGLSQVGPGGGQPR